jgi:thiol:disulfide interchange protein DsbD
VKRVLPALALAQALALAVAGGADAAPNPAPEQLVRIEAALQAAAEPGKGRLRLDVRIADGWHVNSHTPSEDYLIPTSVALDPAPFVEAGPARYPDGKLLKFAFSDQPLSVYEDRFSIEIPVAWSGKSSPEVTGKLEFQACNDKQCLAPASVAFRAAAGLPGDAAGGAPAPLSGGAVALSDAPASGAAPAAGASRDFGALLEKRGILVVLSLLFLGGLALNLTPCVYPVIPLTVSFFGGQAHGQRRRSFALAALYVLGMATMYSGLGVAAALSGKLFGAALQSPWVLGGVAAVLVALALSMFGLYDLVMPSALVQKTGARTGAVGAYAMGMLVGIVAAPCVGPFVLGLLAFVAARQNALLGFVLFFALSLGLGLPYLFLAAFSGRIAALPRAGFWMEGVKKIFGWVLLAMAAYFVKTALPEPLKDWLLPAVLAAGAVGVLARGGLKLSIRAAVAVLFAAAAFFFAPREIEGRTGPAWAPYEASIVAAAGRPAIVDFSASWCLPCIELDKKTFSDPRVKVAFEKRALFKADMTKTSSPETQALAQKYAILGVPTLIFLDATGHERADIRLVGFEDADTFLKRLERAP